MQMGMHGLDRTFNSLGLSGKSHVSPCLFMENGWCCSHGVLSSPTELASMDYSFQPDRKRQPNASRS